MENEIIYNGENENNIFRNKMEITQDTSDGYHTFRELYEHRRVLTKSLFNMDKENCIKSWLHDDGTMFDNYFIVGIITANGIASYHYHKDFWSEFECSEVLRFPAWDGHTAKDSIDRIDNHFKDLKLSES
jgi:hypothetical protein